jgi:hypothetical protein
VITTEEVANLAGSLGTVEGLAQVNASMASLSRQLRDGKGMFSRNELSQMIAALDYLSAAILSMDRVTRELLGQHKGALDCVG